MSNEKFISDSNFGLETEVCEGAVSLGHLVHIFLALVSTALIIECVSRFRQPACQP